MARLYCDRCARWALITADEYDYIVDRAMHRECLPGVLRLDCRAWSAVLFAAAVHDVVLRLALLIRGHLHARRVRPVWRA